LGGPAYAPRRRGAGPVSPPRSAQLGAFLTIAGVNAGRELGPLAALWYRF